MDFLKDNQKLRIIPKEIRGISNGVIKEIYPQYFTVQLDKNSVLDPCDIIEVIIPSLECLMRFETKFLKLENGLAFFSIPEKVKYIQRREYSRVDIKLPVLLKETKNPDKVFNSTTQDLGGGGMQILSSQNFDLEVLLEAKFSIFNKKDIKTIFKVLRVTQNKLENKDYLISGQFKEISNIDRTAIIQLCFKRQLELKCKEIKLE